jgi:hypothetical protein
MAVRFETSVFGILSWLKEQQPAGYVSVDTAAVQFNLEPEQMRRYFQWLQRYECVRRGGRGSAEWRITELGLVRLSEGRFSKRGAFLSPYEHAGVSPQSNPDLIQPSPDTASSQTAARDTLDSWTGSTVPVWARPSESSD